MPRPLGSYPEFTRWSSKPRSWASGRAVFGAGAIEDLIAGVHGHPAAVDERFPLKAEAVPIAIGCVAWFDHPRISNALASLGGSCIVVDKSAQHSPTLRKFDERAQGVWQGGLPGLRDLAPHRVVIGPWGPEPGDFEVGPLRVAGWSGEWRGRPLLHTKLLVLAAHWHWEIDTGYGGYVQDEITPMRAWMGSANWTVNAARHLEAGTWIDDDEFCEHALGFLSSVVAFSEPFHPGQSESVRPNPNMVPIEWDDEACRDAVSQFAHHTE